MPTILPLHDDIIFQEMMSHPVLFSHPHPKIIAVLGDNKHGIAQEVNKHPNIEQLYHVEKDVSQWLEACEPDSIDILIVAEDPSPQHFEHFFRLLKMDGILIQRTESPFQLSILKNLQIQLIEVGFPDIHFLSFPQPEFPSGWRTAIIAKKPGHFRRIREKDIFNKNFSTRYYNFDVHKASLVLPEFMREELVPIDD